MHDQTNDNGPHMKLNNFYGKEIMNWMIHHGNLKFSLPHMNYVLVETWETLRLSPATTTHKYFKRKNFLSVSQPEIFTNHRACLAVTQQSNREKLYGIGRIAKASIDPIDMEEVSTTDPIVILREKGRCISSRKLLYDAYDTVRAPTVLPLNQTKTVKR